MWRRRSQRTCLCGRNAMAAWRVLSARRRINGSSINMAAAIALAINGVT